MHRLDLCSFLNGGHMRYAIILGYAMSLVVKLL